MSTIPYTRGTPTAYKERKGLGGWHPRGAVAWDHGGKTVGVKTHAGRELELRRGWTRPERIPPSKKASKRQRLVRIVKQLIGLPPDVPSFLSREPFNRERTSALEQLTPPEESEVYKEYVRREPCCNCGRPPRSDPHHESAPGQPRRGVRQKARDTLTVGLCRGLGRCHQIYTNAILSDGSISGRLPDPTKYLFPQSGKIYLRSREESLVILHAEQDRLTTKALASLPLAIRIEVQSKALALVCEDVLRAALLGERGTEP